MRNEVAASELVRTSTQGQMGWSVACEGLSKSVSDGDEELHILRDISLEVAPGSSLAILGPSGCGKSTLLGLLAGLDVPTSGRVSWNGDAISSLGEEERAARRRSRVGFVFQSFQLLPQLTALENAILPLELAGESDARGRGLEMLRSVGLAERANHFPATLSGGEQQRVALARAFVSRPSILFADEPTGSLDAASGARVMEIFFGLQEELGVTLVIVTHDSGLAAQCKDRLQLLAGRIV
ncbi:MAG: hypothetical protein RL617_422 [Pseudomonadota bacterium]